jgi:KDO2-lipid IV(A) lauroyltransferase
VKFKLKHTPRWMHAPIYAAIRSVLAALGSMPPAPAIETARAAGRLYARAPFNRPRLQRALDNLTTAFPHWDDRRRRDTAVHAYEHLFALAAETVFIQRLLNHDGWSRFIEFGPMPAGVRRLLEERPCVQITGHYGNWELLGGSLALLGFPTHALYRPLDLQPLDNWVRRSRERNGLKLVGKFGGGDDLTDLMAGGAMPGIVADQNAGDRGLFVPFFGRLVSSYKSVALLAQASNSGVLVGTARRLRPDQIARPDPELGPLRYRIEVVDSFGPDEYRAAPDPTFYITARYRRAIESAVRLAPEQFLWMHRYWKSRPRHERLGQPFPPALRRKLEQLPWMTQAELDLIQTRSAEDTKAWAEKHPQPPEPEHAAGPGLPARANSLTTTPEPDPAAQPGSA